MISGQIADGAVGTDDIADGAVTSDKLDGTLAGQIADISGKQDIAMGVGHENHIVTTDASGNITSAATIGQDKVTGLKGYWFDHGFGGQGRCVRVGRN